MPISASSLSIRKCHSVGSSDLKTQPSDRSWQGSIWSADAESVNAAAGCARLMNKTRTRGARDVKSFASIGEDSAGRVGL
jgi:hypothetical protein